MVFLLGLDEVVRRNARGLSEMQPQSWSGPPGALGMVSGRLFCPGPTLGVTCHRLALQEAEAEMDWRGADYSRVAMVQGTGSASLEGCKQRPPVREAVLGGRGQALVPLLRSLLVGPPHAPDPQSVNKLEDRREP